MTLKIGLASDHAGTDVKTMLVEFLKVAGYEVYDFGVGPEAQTSVDYPDYAELLASNIISGKVDRGVAVCGTGIGMSIAANKLPGIRAAVVWDEYTARMARMHNDANVLCIGSRTLNMHRAVDLVKLWLDHSVDGERHQMRIKKIHELERRFRETPAK